MKTDLSMLTPAEARELLLAAAKPFAVTETVETLAANRRVLAVDVVSPLNVPPADVSAMDGYALRAADAATAGTRLRVSQRVPAGHPPQPLEAGTAARIFTGAQVPPGADTVVIQEDTTADGDHVTLNIAAQPAANINRQGADIRAGAAVLQAGHRLDAQALGLAASVGRASLTVARRPKVAIFFTGDELAMPGTPLREGSIYNSSRFTLTTLLENLGCDVTDFGIVPDKLETTREVLRQAAQGNDLVLTSGGVSVGEEDHVKAAVEAEGRIDMWKIAMKPGKPLAFGEIRDCSSAAVPGSEAASDTIGGTSGAAGRAAYFIGLPGNPVSSFVGFLLFVRPFVLRLQGATDLEPRGLSLTANFSLKKADRRHEYLRARVGEDGGLELFTNQSSAVLTSTVWADGLIDNPPNHRIEAGERVRFLPFSELLY
ncbi:Molybdopterin molybdenumtransferase [Pararobbsia alpina]|uniref:Molybdopterin molybdenumtransferase n=2 Tax=Pararobbsia alpina TaxID=621374 RepID=A0A6S7BFB6_9BURK|nr:Molybdopterin molybdenumtransferase [Pararobbsia alpina]